MIYSIAKFFQRLTLKLFSKWTINGIEHVPPIGGVIIVANHVSEFDPPLLASTFDRKIKFLAKSGIFSGFFQRWFLKEYGAFPVKRGVVDRSAYLWILEQLELGNAVVVFPEGTRSMKGMRKGKSGVARIALHSKSPILPVGIIGTKNMGKWTRVFYPSGKIQVNIGRVFNLPDIEGHINHQLLESMSEMIMERIAELLPNEYRGYYSSTNLKENS